MKKYFLLLPVVMLLFSCASDTETTDTDTPATDTTATAPPAEDPALANLDEGTRRMYIEQYGIDIYRGIPEGLKVGDSAPIFKAKDQNGNEHFLPDLYKKQPVVLMFYRGAWCPACNKHLAAFEDSVKYIKNAGGMIVAVSPETMENVKETVKLTEASYPILPDPNGFIMSAFKLDFYVAEGYQKMINEKLNADIATSNGTKDARLPVPATYIIGTDGKIKYVYFHPDYHQRATVKEIVDELKKL
jgi:peroxiredoxin